MSINLPFEPDDGFNLDLEAEGGVVAGAVVVLGGTIPIEGHGVWPSIVFRFLGPDGEFYKPIALVLNDHDAEQLTEIVTKAVAASRAAARASS